MLPWVDVRVESGNGWAAVHSQGCQRGLGGAEEMCSRSVHRHRWGTQNWSQIHELACIYLNCWFSEPNLPIHNWGGHQSLIYELTIQRIDRISFFSLSFLEAKETDSFVDLLMFLVSTFDKKVERCLIKDWMIWSCILFSWKGCVVCITEMTIWFDHVYTLSKENDETWIPVEKKKRLSILAWLDLIRPRIVVIQIRGYQSDALPCVV